MATTNIQSFSGKIEVNGTTPSSSKITGALTVAGGVGIADALYGANANLEDVEADSVNITDSTPSSSKITGALKVAGGVGVSGALYGANANLEDVEADSVNVTDTTASTSTTTGALTVTGGVGVASNIHTSNLFASDYVGIGTTSPRQKLEVANGSIAIVQNNYKSGADDDQFAGKIDFHLGVGVGELVTPVATIEAYDKWTSGGSYFGALAFKTMNSEKMRIHSNGYVGIGTPSPDAPLVVQVGGTDSTARTGLILRTPESADETGYNIDFYQSTALVSRIAALTESSGQIGMAFSTYNGSTAERMRIDANGNVGIGTDDPATYLHLSATNSDPGDTEGDLVGTHNLTEYLRFTSKGDSGDVNSVSVGFKLGADDNSDLSPDGRLDICANDGSVVGNSYGTIPDKTIATFLGSGYVGIGTTNPELDLHVYGGIITENSGAITPQIQFKSGANNTNGWLMRANISDSFAGKFTIDRQDNSVNPNKFVINNNGNVGIGTESPTAQLTLGASSGSELAVTDKTRLLSNTHYLNYTSSTAADFEQVLLQFDTGGTYGPDQSEYAGYIDVEMVAQRTTSGYSSEIFTARLNYILAWNEQSDTWQFTTFVQENKSVSADVAEAYKIFRGVPVFKYKYVDRQLQIYVSFNANWFRGHTSFTARVTSDNPADVSMPGPDALMASGTDGTAEVGICYGIGTNAANVGIGVTNPTRSLQIERGISYISGGTSNNSAFEIVQQLGTDDYTFNGQHRAQFRIKSGLGTYSNRSLELALLDNGRGIMQASAASEGYFPISINPKGDYNSTVSIGSYYSSAKLRVEGNVYATSDLTTSARIGAGVYTSLSNKLQVAGTTASQKFNSYYHTTGTVSSNQTYSLTANQWTKAWDPAAGQSNQTILPGYYFVTVERRDGNQYERALGWMYVGGYPPTGVSVWAAGSFTSLGGLSIGATYATSLDLGNVGDASFPTSYQIEITKISGYVATNDYVG
jgi:hypothetical protein